MIIKKLKRKIEVMNDKIKSEIMSEEERNECRKKLGYFNMLMDFINEGSWAKSEKVKEKARIYINKGVEGLQAEYKDMNKKQVGRFVYYINSLVESYITDRMLEQIEEGNGDKAMGLFRSKSMYTGSLFVDEVEKSIKELDIVGINLEALNSCEKEIKFLKKYSIKAMEQEYNALNKERLAYLINIMKSKDKRLDNYKGVIFQYLQQGRGSAESVVKMFNKIFNGG